MKTRCVGEPIQLSYYHIMATTFLNFLPMCQNRLENELSF